MHILIMNVLYPPIQVGGAEKAAQLLANSFASRGDKVTVVTLHPEASETVEDQGGVRVYRLPMDNLYWPYRVDKKHNPLEKLWWHLRDIWNRKAAGRVGRILDAERPDVVHTHNISGFSVAVWREVKKRNIRLVHTLHDYAMLCTRSNLFRDGKPCEQRCISCRAMTSLSKVSSSEVDAVVSVSQAVLNTHQKYGYFENVDSAVIYNIEPSVDAPTGAAEMVQPVGEELVFGFIGKLSQAKGIAMLLQATTRLSRGDWKLRIAGRGKDVYVSELKDTFRDPRIEWVGYTASRPFYASIDVTVVPSLWWDPLPYVVIESFSAGKSVICAESGGLPELAALGRRVRTYPALDVDALVNAMEDALRDKDLWRTGGFKAADSKLPFIEENVVRRYRGVYEGVGAERDLYSHAK